MASKKEGLIEAAMRHFSRYGYSGASMEAIAAEVQMTKASIYYHFKDKQQLYTEVVERQLVMLADALDRAEEIVDVERKLYCYIETFGEFLRHNPYLAPILAHEFADGGGHLSEACVRQLARTLGLLTKILNEGVEASRFVVENPMVVQMMVVTTLTMHQTTQGLRSRVSALVPDTFSLLPEPEMDDYAKILASRVLESLTCRKDYE